MPLSGFLVSAIGLFFLVDAIRKIALSTTLADPPTLRSIGGIAVVDVLVLFGCFLQGWRNLRSITIAIVSRSIFLRMALSFYKVVSRATHCAG
ncbi:hypothetical protein [Dictyobacter vulcani]|uniref:hypothetical protein n=1 Tax=Dictyobacter vulcani TaxID=2607529 RepID=UPI00124FCD1D|nr:hypothetical protein [Dictyobacter vulcani]